MEKYKVVKVDVKNAFYQTLELKGNNIWAYDRLKSIQVDRTNPRFKEGDTFKIYRDKYGIEVEVHNGGQPVYYYFLSVE